ncbi:helix-turn-helix domain-containing protein [Brevibacillus sp. SYP-B805]|nr:helix-turn-helix domain-containing protein [Brevibacillus sp. SYP-B805]
MSGKKRLSSVASDCQDKEKTQREIARELGISRSFVSRIEKRALMKLFDEFYWSKQAQNR